MVRSACAVRARRSSTAESSLADERLLRKLVRENLRLRGELRELRKLRRWACEDQLTGLPNRRLFEERLTEELSRAASDPKQCGSLLVVDVNRLKSVNDRFGHLAGDEALRETARVLRATLRTSDVCCRTGGDEFMILLPDTDVESARLVMIRLRTALFHAGARCDTPIGVSLGRATWPTDGNDGGLLIEKADTDMYEDKRALASRSRRPRNGARRTLSLVK